MSQGVERATKKTPRSLSSQQTEAQLTAEWDIRGIDIAGMSFDKGTAVDRDRRRRVASTPPPPVLPALLAPGAQGATPQFVLGDILGEGGMGVVRSAAQTALDRPVAVKGLKPEANLDSATLQLLREGRVTGALEHPNVVPVYALGRDNDGRPLLVMKRIEGRSWSQGTDHADREEAPETNI